MISDEGYKSCATHLSKLRIFMKCTGMEILTRPAYLEACHRHDALVTAFSGIEGQDYAVIIDAIKSQQNLTKKLRQTVSLMRLNTAPK